MGIDENSPCIRGPFSGDDEPSHHNAFSEIDWIPAQRVHLRPGITVRVKRDAFADTPKLAATHAGRVGTILRISGGDVVLKSTDRRRPQLDGAHYSPWILEMLLDDCLPSATKSGTL